MSSSAAPEWLKAPADPNDLPGKVWPRSAQRDADGALHLAGASVIQLAAEHGTPLVVIDEVEARSRATEAFDAFTSAAAHAGTSARVYYAGKAMLNGTVCGWMVDAGLNVDVCTGGELAVALAAGVPPERIGFHGNNKREWELERAVEAGVGTIIVDSPIEIERLAVIAAAAETVQNVLVRVATGVHAETHDFLSTAHEDQKFGFAPASVPQIVRRVRELDSLHFLGLHGHIGSQIFGVAGFRESAARLVELYEEVGEVEVLNLGGGFGIAYTSVDDPASLSDLAFGITGAVADQCAVRGLPLPVLAFEPGRAIVGTAGVTLYEVGTIKPVTVQTDEGTAERLYVSVDGGMSDNPRMALYGAQYSARIASREGTGEPALARVVGVHCESGDIVVDHEYLPADVAPGDLLAVPATGAYTVALSSNYNHVPRPPVIAVRDGASRVIVRGETIDDLLTRDPALDAGRAGQASQAGTSTEGDE
ncbi:MAG: diaminopimelate decarboxylase [Microbacterium sp.]